MISLRPLLAILILEALGGPALLLADDPTPADPPPAASEQPAESPRILAFADPLSDTPLKKIEQQINRDADATALVVYLQASPANLGKVKLRLHLTDQVGAPIGLLAEPAEQTIPSQHRKLVRAEVTGLKRAGTFTGWLVAEDPQRMYVISEVVIERPYPAELAIDLHAPKKVSGISSPGFTASPSVWFTLREKSGQPATLHAPQFINLATESGKQANHSRIRFYNEDGTRIASDFVLEGEPKTIRMQIEDLHSVGSYQGQLLITGQDGTSLPLKEIQFDMKLNGMLAGVVILAGVLLSMLLRQLGTRRLPQLRQQRRALEFRKTLKLRQQELNLLDGPEKNVHEALLRELDQLDQAIEQTKADINARMARIEEKLVVFPKWVNTRRQLLAVRPKEIVKALLTRLETVQTYLCDPASTAAVKDQLTLLEEIEQQIPVAIREDLQAKINEVATEVQAVLAGAGVSPAAIGELTDLDGKLQSAHALAGEDKIEPARELFEEARQEYAVYLARLFLQQVQAAEAPAWTTDPDWNDLVADVEAILKSIIGGATATADRAAGEYNRANQLYFKTLLDALEAKLIDAAAQHTAPLSPAETVFNAACAKLARNVHELRKRLEADDFRAVADGYRKAADELLAEEAKLHPPPPAAAAGMVPFAGPMMGSPPGTGAAESYSIPSMPGQEAVWRIGEYAPHRLTLQEIDEQLRYAEALFFVASLVVAIVLGLSALWASEPVWGTPANLITAFLWGLGLHTIGANTAFSGVNWLQQRYSEPPPASPAT